MLPLRAGKIDGILLKIKLHTHMRGLKSEPFIKPVRISPPPVRRKLHQKAPALASLFNRPPHHLSADSSASQIAPYAHRLHLRSPSSTASESRQITELHSSGRFAIQFCDHDPMIRMRLNLNESALVLWHQRYCIKRMAHCILRHQLQNRRKVSACRIANY